MSDLDASAPSRRPAAIDPDEFERAYGETLAETLDFGTWRDGDDLAAAYQRLSEEVDKAVRLETELKEKTRRHVLPRLSERDSRLGVARIDVDEIKHLHEGLLFNGAVEACDGTSTIHDTLPLTVAQVGVCLVAYQGRQNSWVRRTFRRDLRIRGGDPIEEVLDVLARRERRSSDLTGNHDQLTDLGRRGIMGWAERAILREQGRGNWYMGHGSALPYELLTGSGHPGLLDRSLELLEWLWLEHKRAVYVPSSIDRVLLTIGNALHPLEYALVETMADRSSVVVDQGHFSQRERRRLEEFVAEVASRVVVGVFRASAQAPAYAFYAHAEYAHLAARIAIADAALQEHRGFPMLIDLAHALCQTAFGTGAFHALLESAYADASAPFAYQPERLSRA